MWYRFEKGNPIGILRVIGYTVSFYDLDGDCFDETHYAPEKINEVITYVETIEDVEKHHRTKVFVNFDNGDVYEMKMEKVKRLVL